MSGDGAQAKDEVAWFLSPRAWLMLWIPIAAVSYFHYSTGASHHWLHDIFRRLYYIPIILGAFSYGIKGGLSASVVASLVYAPHAFSHFFEHDPGATIEKLLEVGLYNVVALITGYLAQRERSERVRQEAIARELSRTLEEKKLLEQQLIRAGKLKALGELTAGIAHEIKNPLASIKGAAEAIADEVAEDSPRRALVRIQHRELNRLGQTLDRFLSFARPNRFMPARVDLQELVAHVIDLVMPQARNRAVQVVADSRSEPLFVHGDRDQLTQVLVNLALNAFDAMPQGGQVRLLVRSALVGSNRFRAIEVFDTGPGIPHESRDRVFDPFFSTKEGGTGLGLSISANIVDGHGGFMRVGAGAGGVGTRISVFLPEHLPNGSNEGDNGT
jgi:two-component system sensor histidine kinase HydH